MEKIIPISDLQTKAKRYVDQVRKTDEPIIITQHGRAAAILVNYETYEGHRIRKMKPPIRTQKSDWGAPNKKVKAEKGCC